MGINIQCSYVVMRHRQNNLKKLNHNKSPFGQASPGVMALSVKGCDFKICMIGG